MALKSIGILIALCATCTIAIAREISFTAEHEYYRNPNNVDYGARKQPANDEYAVLKGPSFEESGGWEHQSFPKPDFSHNSESGDWIYGGHKKPHFPHNFKGLGDHHGPILHFPHGFSESGIFNYHGPHKPHLPHASEESIAHRGLPSTHVSHNPHKSGKVEPHFSLSSDESIASNGFTNIHVPYSPHESGESNHYHQAKPHFSHNSEELKVLLPNLHLSRSLHESGESNYHSLPKPYFPHSSEESIVPHKLPSLYLPHGPHESVESNYNSLPKPYFPHSSEESIMPHEHPNLHFPRGPYESAEINSDSLPKPHFPHSSEESLTHHGLHKPHFPHNSQELGEHNLGNYNFLRPHVSLSGEPEWGHKTHHPDWYNPQFPKHSEPLEHYEEMERRRPLFYPILPYHPFYPHAHPSTNDEEFETIEALKGKNQRSGNRPAFVRALDSTPEDSQQQKYEGPYYHGPHNPHFPINFDGTETSENVPFGSLHNSLPYPHFKPFHKEPVLPEENVVIPPNIFGQPDISDVDFPNVDEAQPYGLPIPSENNESFQGPLIIIGNDENFKIPDIIFDILEHFHHGHGKPQRPEDHKPNDEDIVDEEGSGEEEVIPLSVGARIPLIRE